jgi:Fur family zinc uptake transcriptional regulator
MATTPNLSATAASCDCAHARRHAAQASEGLAGIAEECGRRGLRLTESRRLLLECLWETHRPAGAYDLVARVSARTGKPVAPITVYRALDFLLEHGFVHRLASRNAYLPCCAGQAHEGPVTFLICETCGGVDETASAAVGSALTTLAAAEKFTVRHAVVEVTGLCGHCREG